MPKKPHHGGVEFGDESLEAGSVPLETSVAETGVPRKDPWMPCVTKASSSTSGVQSVEVDIPSPVQLCEQQLMKS